MEQPRFLVYLLVVTSVFVSVCGIECYTFYENSSLGHVRYENGTIVWGIFPPPIDYSGGKPDTRSDGWDVTVAFAIAIVDSVQTQAFPYDLLRRIIRDDYSTSEVLSYQTNVIGVAALGAVLGLCILLTVLIYRLREWRRGDKSEFNVNFADFITSRAQYILGFGACLMAVDAIFVLCSLIVSSNALVGALDLGSGVNDAMDDVIKYFDGMQQHYNFIATNTSQWFINEVLITDMNEVGRLIWETGRDEFLPQISPTFDLVANLDSDAENVLTLLSSLYSNLQATIADPITELDDVLTTVHYNLSLAVTDFSCGGCDGSCSGCSAILPDDIFLMADFTNLPNVSSNIDSLTTFLSSNVSGTTQSPEYYFLYGIGEQLTQDAGVREGKDELIQDLIAYSNTWGNSTNDIIYPNESIFWFDTLQPRWNDFYEDLKTQEAVRYTFIMVFCLLTYAVMGITVYSLYLAYNEGLFKPDKTRFEDFSRSKRILGWCLVGQMALASSHMVMSAAGFYTGANLETAVCKPGESLDAAENTIDYYDAMPGHPGFYLSDVLLGNGSIATLKLSNMLTSCSNGTGAYSEFLHDIIVPNLQQDLQNYQQYFTDAVTKFDKMRVSLDPSTTLVPPDFEYWLANFTAFTDFNYTQYEDMLNGVVIIADVDTYTANLLVVHDTPYASGGPFEPSKSRLPIAVDLLQGQKSNIDGLGVTTTELASVFSSFVTARNNILTTANTTTEQLRALESDLISMSGPAISRGVDQYMAEFLSALDYGANSSWEWVGEAAPCQQISDAYYSALTSFCDQYADYENASWLMLGHTCLFLLSVTFVSFCIYRSMPDPPEKPIESPFDVDAKTRILMIEEKDKKPVIAVATRGGKGEGYLGGGIDSPFDITDDLETACSSPAPTGTQLPAGNSRYQKGGRVRKSGYDAWIDTRSSLASAGRVTPVSPTIQIHTIDEELESHA